ncbi:MAG: TauD/TfdA family dioxygenase [Betaproteobacteria bacterium]|nr:TauD/TfdA family dioxygenase [Betaproteobacteria bacterium]
MALSVRPMHDALGAEIEGVDLARPLDGETFARILAAHHRHGVILFRGQGFTPQQHIAFSRRFGELLVHVLDQFLLPDYPEILIVTNARREGKPLGVANAGRTWHSDMSYMKEPSLGSLLYALEVPEEGGDTLFASMGAAYDGLSEAMKKRIAKLSAVHSYWHNYQYHVTGREPLTPEQRVKTPPTAHPVVRTHPATGRKGIYVSETFCDEIPGMPADEARDLLRELFVHQVKPEYVMRQQWRVGDLIFWDNRAATHQAQPYDDTKYVRYMHRTTVKGDAPY